MIDGIDAGAGDLIERASRAHHRRRLRRIGRGAALQGRTGWASAGAPARDGNAVEIDVDGSAALPAMAAAIRGARRSVHVAGWAIAPDFRVERDPPVSLRALLAEAAERVEVRVLTWAGAPVPLFHPTRGEARRNLEGLTHGTDIRGALDARNRPMHCHHEKLVVVDGTIAFVGGIDLTAAGGDRFDHPGHATATRLGWHDVAARLSGPAVGDVAAHFAMRWRETTGETLEETPAPLAAGASRVQVARTVPERVYAALPRGDFGILEAHLGALRSAERLISLENQFLWSAEVVAVLRDKLQRPPCADFRICMILPRQPNNGRDATLGQLGVLRDADRERRLLVGTIGPAGGERPPVYVHAKVAIVDDRWMTIGSANLNEHSLFNDTEVNLISDDAGLARDVRERLWSEHLGVECAGRDALELIEERWRPLVDGVSGSRPPLRSLPHVSRRTARLLGPLNGLVVDG